MPRYDLTAMTNTDTDFYLVMGPFLASRAVHKQVGGPIWDDEGKIWIVAREGDRTVGFIAVTTAGRVESLYTVEGGKPLRQRLVKAAMRGRTGRLVATVSHQNADAYTGAGFAYVSETANFVRLEYTP